MLTADLVRARVVKGEVKPRWVDAKDPELLGLAEEMVGLFAQHVGKTRGALDDALTTLLGEGTDYLLHRGLAKLLSDRADFEVASTVDPRELREAVFDESARHHPIVGVTDVLHDTTREMVLARVGERFSMDAETLSRCLYADLESEQVMTKGPDLEPEALLQRYNLALAQAVLLRATGLSITVGRGDPARYRQLFRWVKFFRLMHRVGGTADTGYALQLDGPLSLFQQSQKYGLQLAEFLPALLKCEQWEAEAEVLWGVEKKRFVFRLKSDQGLVSHWRETGVYVSREEQWLLERFAALNTPWTLERRAEIYDLGGRGVLVPDLVAAHPDGRVAYVEVVGFWKRDYLEARAKLLREEGPPNLVLAVPARLKGDDADAKDLAVETVFYKDVILAKELLAKVEKVAVQSAAPATKPEKKPAKARAEPKAKRAKKAPEG